MPMRTRLPHESLLQDLPDATKGEVLQVLLSEPQLRLERIVSLGQASPPGFWYDQAEIEWVVLIEGSAEILFEDESVARHLRLGDFLHIAAHRRHRIEATAHDQVTIWLALFYWEQ